jgi:hypothetical protein
MTAKNAKEDNKNKTGSSSLPFEIRERATISSSLQPQEEKKNNSKDLARKGLKQLSAQKNLMQC